MPRLTTIRSRLLFYYLLSFALLIGVSATAFFAIGSLDRLTTAFDRRWVAGTAILGEMADLLSEIRLGETRLALASTPAQEAQAVAYTDEHITAISEQRAAFATLDKSTKEASLLEAFDHELKEWLDKHREWMKLAAGQRKASSAAFQIAADTLYRNADDAIDALIEINTDGAKAAGRRADRITETTALIVSAAVLLALLLAGWVAIMIRNQISRPLMSITAALSDLAGGNRNRVIPESRRRDEIGKLAQAFEIFRADAFALEAAHRAAEEAEVQARMLARHDPLTGLTNRRVLAEDLEKAFGRVQRYGRTFAVLLIDLDRFKPVNDIHGHIAGDLVLCEIANRLKEIVRKNDSLSRIGGDEFAIICDLGAKSAETSEEIILFAQRVLMAVRAPIQLQEARVDVAASIGIALGPANGNNAETILRAADIAMYRAKDAGRDAFRFYEQSMDDELRTRAELETDVRQAVAADAIQPYYQPLIELSSGKTLGFEVLARWSHPTRGSIPPIEFIPIIEHLGLMADFTWSMLRRAFLDARGWSEDLGLSVNISPVQLRDLTFSVRLLTLLQETGFSPRRLEIEITETALLSDLETVKATLASLQALGIKVAIDDFGTGYSSLYHLRELRLDKIKIDRGFIQSMSVNPESAKIVNAILGLAKSLDLPTTAEGIENAEMRDRVSKAGCDIGQGYYFARAMPAAEVGAWTKGSGLPAAGGRKIA